MHRVWGCCEQRGKGTNGLKTSNFNNNRRKGHTQAKGVLLVGSVHHSAPNIFSETLKLFPEENPHFVDTSSLNDTGTPASNDNTLVCDEQGHHPYSTDLRTRRSETQPQVCELQMCIRMAPQTSDAYRTLGNQQIATAMPLPPLQGGTF